MAQTVRNVLAIQETWVQSLGWEDSLRREWLPTPAFLHGKFHGQRSQAGYSPWDHRESDMTEKLTLFPHHDFEIHLSYCMCQQFLFIAW